MKKDSNEISISVVITKLSLKLFILYYDILYPCQRWQICQQLCDTHKKGYTVCLLSIFLLFEFHIVINYVYYIISLIIWGKYKEWYYCVKSIIYSNIAVRIYLYFVMIIICNNIFTIQVNIIFSTKVTSWN